MTTLTSKLYIMKNSIYFILLTFFTLTLSCKEKENHIAVQEKEPYKNTDNAKEDREHKKISVSEAQFKNGNMQLGNLIKHAFPTTIKVTGMVDAPPQSKAVITSYYAGNVKNSKLLIGDKVRKGQVLVTIANPEFVDIQQDFLEISEQLIYLKTEYERQKTLFDEKITSQKSYLKAKSNYDRQKARYNGLRKKLQMLNIHPENVKQGKITSTISLYAPINGYITKVNVNKGTYVSPQDIVLEIVNTDHIHIELTAFEKDVMAIKKGQKINFKIPEASNEVFEAEVHLVGTSIDETSRTVKVHGHLHDEKKNTFAIGMFVDATIETSSKNAMGLPEDALIENEGENFVLVLEDNKNGYTFNAVAVNVGKKHNGFIEIISDNITPAQKIVTKGAFSLLGGEEGSEHSH